MIPTIQPIYTLSPKQFIKVSSLSNCDIIEVMNIGHKTHQVSRRLDSFDRKLERIEQISNSICLLSTSCYFFLYDLNSIKQYKKWPSEAKISCAKYEETFDDESKKMKKKLAICINKKIFVYELKEELSLVCSQMLPEQIVAVD